MTTTERIPLAQAEAVAHELVGILSPACERIEIGGSIRRRKAAIKDIEIVCIPILEVTRRDLFGTPIEIRSMFDALCTSLLDQGVFDYRLDKNGVRAWGERYKRGMFKGMAIDLFSANEDNWGVQFLLRTGPAEFNHRLVTSKAFGGLMPFGYQMRDGYLWRGDDRLMTPTESHVFDALGVAWAEPEHRR